MDWETFKQKQFREDAINNIRKLSTKYPQHPWLIVFDFLEDYSKGPSNLANTQSFFEIRNASLSARLSMHFGVELDERLIVINDSSTNTRLLCEDESLLWHFRLSGATQIVDLRNTEKSIAFLVNLDTILRDQLKDVTCEALPHYLIRSR